MQIFEVINELEEFAPLSLQESYDNAGLLVGDRNCEVRSVLCSLDVTDDIMDEAINLDVNLIISHHPFIFGNVKSLTGKNATERIMIKAIKHDIAIYAGHTNFDSVHLGVNNIICEKLGLHNLEILAPKSDLLYKLVTFVPESHSEELRQSLMESGAGHIGKYDNCSFSAIGKGSFRGGEDTKPFVGEKGKVHFENEIRIETIVPKYSLKKVLKSLKKTHPYEEVAYDIYPLKNEFSEVGSGMIGTFTTGLNKEDFLKKVQSTFGIPVIRFSGKENSMIKKVAVCGGSGSFLLANAIHQGADAFLTGDLKYHQFFDVENQLLLCDIGHYESEQFTKEIFYTLLTKKFSTFAVHLTSIVTNPIKYYV